MLCVNVRYRLPMTSSVDLGVAEFRRALTEAWRACGMHLFERFVEKHFTAAGAKQYNYTPRAGEGESGKAFWKSYTGRKQRKMHHTLPLVYSGRTREGAKRSTIYATSKGVRVALPGLVHLNRYKPKPQVHGSHAGQQVDLREDLLTVSPAEVEELAKIHQQEMQRQLGVRVAWADVQMK